MDRDMMMTLFVAILSLVVGIMGHGSGAPSSKCESMIPGHWVEGQRSPSPYVIELSSYELKEGQRLSINLTSSPQLDGFKGFLITMKRPGEESNNFGEFDVVRSSEEAQPLDCFSRQNSAMTHKDSAPKAFVHLEWIAPILNGDDDAVDFDVRVTFVQNFWTIWPNQKGKKLIRVSKNEISSENLSKSPIEGPMVVLVPRLRDADSVGHGQSPSTNIGNDAYSYLEGSWEYFKKSVVNFLSYFNLNKNQQASNHTLPAGQGVSPKMIFPA